MAALAPDNLRWTFMYNSSQVKFEAAQTLMGRFKEARAELDVWLSRKNARLTEYETLRVSIAAHRHRSTGLGVWKNNIAAHKYIQHSSAQGVPSTANCAA